MWKNLLDSFDPQQVEDPHFGLVELQGNDQEGTVYLMKDVWLGDREDAVSLTVESRTKQSSQWQFDLFTLIQQNFSSISRSAFDYIASSFPGQEKEKFKEQYAFESIYIGNANSPISNWELTLVNTEDGAGYCVIDFDKLQPTGISMEE